MKEFKAVLLTEDEFENYVCDCGNTSDSSGFFPCDNNGEEIEPTIDSGWNGLYICLDCHKLIIRSEEKKEIRR